MKYVPFASSMSVRTFWIKDPVGENVTELPFFTMLPGIGDLEGDSRARAVLGVEPDFLLSKVRHALLVAIRLLDGDLWHLFWRHDRFGGS